MTVTGSEVAGDGGSPTQGFRRKVSRGVTAGLEQEYATQLAAFLPLTASYGGFS